MCPIQIIYRVIHLRLPLIASTLFLSYAADINAETTATLFADAIKLTVARKPAEAEKLYRRAVELSPADGLPALARFLARTGRTTEAVELIESPQAQKLSPLARARVALAADKPDIASNLLKQPASPGELYAHSVQQATQLRLSGKNQDAAAALGAVILSSELNGNQRRDLLRKLIVAGGSPELRKTLAPAMDQLITSSTLQYPVLREVAWNAITALSQSNEYAPFRREIAAYRPGSATGAWLRALIAIKGSSPGQALQALESATSATASPREKLMVREELAALVAGNPEKSIQLYEEIIPLAPDTDRLKVAAAHAAFRNKDFAGALKRIREIDRSKLDINDLYLFANLRLSVIGKSASLTELVQAFEEESKGLTWEKLRELSEAPFVRLHETEQHAAVKTAVLNRLKETTAPAELYVLLMSTENQLRNPVGVTQAVASYAKARPDDLDAQKDLADAAAALAPKLAAGHLQTTPTAESIKEIADISAQASWRIIEKKPYVPEPYVQLIELYNLFGQPEKAKQVPRHLISGTSVSAQQYQLAAYIYAKNGFPNEAVPLYERALKEEPNNTNFRLNYAGVLTRLKRYDEAEVIYHDIIRHGVNGKQFHTHSVYPSAYQLARERGRIPQFLAFLLLLANDKTVAEHSRYLIDGSKLLVSHGHTAEAIRLLEAASSLYPDAHDEAMELLIEAHTARRDYRRAEELLKTQDAEATATESKVSARHNLGYLKKTAGDTNGAVETWKALASSFPAERKATRGLIQAAQALNEKGRKDEARKLLEQYKVLDTGDTDGEASAEQVLSLLDQPVTSPAAQTSVKP
jgi:tetratricopeptide (TPR) repeat protein